MPEVGCGEALASVILIDDGPGDVEDLMRQLGAEIEVWSTATHPGTSPAAVVPTQRSGPHAVARQLMLRAQVDGNAIIHSTRPRLGPWLIRFQAAVRRVTWWFLEPILQQIRAFQVDSARAIGDLAREQDALQAQISDLRALLAQEAPSAGGDEHQRHDVGGDSGRQA